jgi:hypothetical protein
MVYCTIFSYPLVGTKHCPSTNLYAGLGEDLAKEVSTNRCAGLDKNPTYQSMSACG